MQRWAGLLVLMMVTPFLHACGGGATTAGDCSLAVRFDGDVYVEAGFSEQSAERLGQAEQATCEDVGREARGSYFPEDADEVSVWSFPGHEPSQVIAMREPTAQVFRVFLVDGLDESGRQGILSGLVTD